jgi:predicted double-glycine peptidase
VQTAINGAKASFPDIKQNDWIELVRLLERDYYLLRDPDTGQLGFKFSVLKRWWQWHRLNQPIMVEEAAS